MRIGNGFAKIIVTKIVDVFPCDEWTAGLLQELHQRGWLLSTSLHTSTIYHPEINLGILLVYWTSRSLEI